MWEWDVSLPDRTCRSKSSIFFWSEWWRSNMTFWKRFTWREQCLKLATHLKLLGTSPTWWVALQVVPVNRSWQTHVSSRQVRAGDLWSLPSAAALPPQSTAGPLHPFLDQISQSAAAAWALPPHSPFPHNYTSTGLLCKVGVYHFNLLPLW